MKSSCESTVEAVSHWWSRASSREFPCDSLYPTPPHHAAALRLVSCAPNAKSRAGITGDDSLIPVLSCGSVGEAHVRISRGGDGDELHFGWLLGPSDRLRGCGRIRGERDRKGAGTDAAVFGYYD